MPTIYRDITFHNVVQARWAFLLDLLTIDWRLANKPPKWLKHNELTPTFHLPSRNTWLRAATDDDAGANRVFEYLEDDGYPDAPPEGGGNLDKAARRSADDERPRHADILLVAASGIPDPAKFENGFYFDRYDSTLMLGDRTMDAAYMWTRCPECGHIDAQYCGRAERLRCGHGDADFGKNYRGDDPFILASYTSARAAVRAKYPARCACNESIAPGHLIMPIRTDQAPRWRHANCWLRAERATPRAEDQAKRHCRRGAG